jgi:hypothetical protein
VLCLCYIKQLNIHLINKIKVYLLEYATGYASFNKKFTINNKEYNFEDRVGHPIEYIPRLLSKFPFIMNTTNEFFNIIENINKVPNIQIIDLTDLYNILFTKNHIKKEIIKPGDFQVLLSLINQYICKLNLGNCINKYYKIINNKLVKYSESKHYINFYIKNMKYNNIEDIIINECGKYRKMLVYDNFFDNNIIDTRYEKIVLNPQELLYIELSRLEFNGEICNNEIIINKIIYLPPFVFNNNTDFHIYELIAILLYTYRDDNCYLYSLIIKENNNKFYHYTEDDIYIINDDEFNAITEHNSFYVFYKKI